MGDTVDIANKEMAEAWDGHEGDAWTEHDEAYHRTGRLLWPRFVDLLAVQPKEDVIDIGCGTGHSTRDVGRLAHRGSALGVDLSARMLERARRLTAEEGPSNVRYVQADAQVHRFEPQSFDLAMSSFGAMFFADPVAAFANIGASLRTGGRLALLAWRDLRRNEWLMSLRGALAQGRDLPYPPANAPTPFSLAEPERVRAVLGAAGFHAVELTAVDQPVDLGPDADAALAFVKTLGIVQGLSHDLDARQRDRSLDEIRRVLTAHETPHGVLLGASTWTITAWRAP